MILMNKQQIYRGMSFIRYKDRKTVTLSDSDLVKQDIINHIYTRRKERIMMPKFGTRIPDMPFEQMDNTLLNNLEYDIQTVVNYDPRVTLRSNEFSSGIRITPFYDDNIIVASVDLFYVELDFSETMEINLEFES